MTYQYLTAYMIATVNKNGTFIDQKTFNTTGEYAFDFLILFEIKHASAQWLHLVR